MKWAITEKQRKKLKKQGMIDEDIAANFSVYDSLSVVDPTLPQGIKKIDPSMAFGIRKSKSKEGSKEKPSPKKTTFYIWTEHADLPKMSQTVQRKYEIFCGGFLYFYDHQLISHEKGKATGEGYLYDLQNDHNLNVGPVLDYFKTKLNKGLLDHEMWFSWEKDPANGKRWKVSIYLNPEPGNPDPPSTPKPPPPETTTSFA